MAEGGFDDPFIEPETGKQTNDDDIELVHRTSTSYPDDDQDQTYYENVDDNTPLLKSGDLTRFSQTDKKTRAEKFIHNEYPEFDPENDFLISFDKDGKVMINFKNIKTGDGFNDPKKLFKADGTMQKKVRDIFNDRDRPLMERVDTKNSEVEDLKQDISRIRNERDKYYKDLSKIYPERNEAKQKVERLNSELVKSEKDLKIVIRERDDLQKTINEKNNKIRKLTGDIDDLKKTIETHVREKNTLEDEIIELKQQRDNAFTSEDQEQLNREIQTKEARIEELNQNIQPLESRIDELTAQKENLEDELGLSLKEKIKRIFKKYGFTAAAVLAAVGAIIGVIISNLKSGLSALGKGLKTLGKKLAGMLPGMIGSIASFIFKTAGEAVKYLAKNAWLG